jgi:hypothetical protein
MTDQVCRTDVAGDPRRIGGRGDDIGPIPAVVALNTVTSRH